MIENLEEIVDLSDKKETMKTPIKKGGALQAALLALLLVGSQAAHHKADLISSHVEVVEKSRNTTELSSAYIAKNSTISSSDEVDSHPVLDEESFLPESSKNDSDFLLNETVTVDTDLASKDSDILKEEDVTPVTLARRDSDSALLSDSSAMSSTGIKDQKEYDTDDIESRPLLDDESVPHEPSKNDSDLLLNETSTIDTDLASKDSDILKEERDVSPLTLARRDSVSTSDSLASLSDNSAMSSTTRIGSDGIDRELQLQLSSFRIMTSYFVESKQTYCLSAQSLSVGSKLVVRHCNGDLRKYFHFDRSGLLRLSAKPELCLRWKLEKAQLEIDNCVNGINNAYFAMGAGRIRAVGFGQDVTQQWLIGLNPNKPTEKVRLYKMSAHRDNKSLFLWFKDFASEAPSNVPTSTPSVSPTSSPSSKPSSEPSVKPSPSPSAKPSPSPTSMPSSEPSDEPSLLPSSEPSMEPSDIPSDMPSNIPSDIPSDQPSRLPSSMPSDIPSDIPSDQPSDIPSDIPSDQPSDIPSDVPSDQPSLLPSDEPSMEPSRDPSSEPSLLPSSEPSSFPTVCADEEGWIVGGESLYAGMTCTQLNSTFNDWCSAVSQVPDHSFNGKSVSEACCACDGSRYQSTFPSSTPSSKPSISSVPTTDSEVPSAAPSSEPSVCEDTPGWEFEQNGALLGCSAIAEYPDHCERFKNLYYLDKNTYSACCSCGGGMHHSVSPSSIPTSRPSMVPSSNPTLSQEPSVAETSSPSGSPSVSQEPSQTPVRPPGTVYDDEECNHTSECKNVGVSSCLPNNDDTIFTSTGKICRASTDSDSERLLEINELQENAQKDSATGLRLRRRDTSVVYDTMSSLFNGVSRAYSPIDNAYRGGILKNANDGLIDLDGNTWNAVKLSHVDQTENPYKTTQHTWMRFTFSLKTETNAHALCLDFDAIASDARKCFYLAGTDVDPTKHFSPKTTIDMQRAKLLNLASGKVASQISADIDDVTDAYKAIDGYIDPKDKHLSVPEKNSVAKTKHESNPWWEVDLQSTVSINRIVVHKAAGYALDEFDLKICSGNDCTVHVDRVVSQNAIIDHSLSTPISGDKVRIEMVGSGILALAEVLVFGPDELNAEGNIVKTFNIPVGRMLMEGISFGYPIWNGIKSQLKSSDSNAVVLDAGNHLVSDVMVKFSSSITTFHAELKKNEELECSVDLDNLATDTVHVTLPPNCIGNKIEIDGDVSQAQVFGSKENNERVYGRPLINFISLIQNDRSEEPSGESSFSNVELYESTVISDDTNMFLPLQVNGVDTSSAISYGNVAAFHQDFGGKVVMSSDKTQATISGNAWKAFQLTTPISVNPRTTLTFSFTLTEQVEGHALCVDNDLDHDPFVGKDLRCILLAGTQFTQWRHVHRKNLALGRTAYQNANLSSGSSLGAAQRGNDGNLNTFTNTGLPDDDSNGNVVDTDFWVQIEYGWVVEEVIIHNRMDSYVERFNDYSVYIRKRDGTTILAEKRFDTIAESGIVRVSGFRNYESEMTRNEGIQVGIKLHNTYTSKYPHMIGEIIVHGRPIIGRETSFTINVSDLFPDPDSDRIRYVALIQDNDGSPSQGQSTFSGIQIQNGSAPPSRGTAMDQENDSNPEIPHQHVDFGNLVAPDLYSDATTNSWSDVNAHFPSRNDGWKVSSDVTKDPKDNCYYSKFFSHGYNLNNRKETVYHNYLKSAFGSVTEAFGFTFSANGAEVHNDNLFCTAGNIQEVDLNGFQESYNAIYGITPVNANKQLQYQEPIQLKATASMSSIAEFAGRKYGPEKAVNRNTSTNLPHFPNDFRWQNGGSPPNGYTCMRFGQLWSDHSYDNKLCWRSAFDTPEIEFYSSEDHISQNYQYSSEDWRDRNKEIRNNGRCSVFPRERHDDAQVCTSKDSPYFMYYEAFTASSFRNMYKHSGLSGNKSLKCMDVTDNDGFVDDKLCNTGSGQLKGSVTSVTAKRGMPWYKLKWKHVYRVTSLEIWTSSNPYFLFQMKNFKTVFLKKGEEVYTHVYNGLPPSGSLTIPNTVLPLDIDEIKIELNSMSFDYYPFPDERNPVLAIEGIEVKGNISVESLMESFKYNPPALPFSGKVKCDDDIEKMAFQALVCDIPNIQPNFYFQGSTQHWWFPHLLVTPSTFQDQIEAFLKSQYTDDEDLVNWMEDSKRYSEEDWTKLAEELAEAYRERYTAQMNSLSTSSFTEYQKNTKCAPKAYAYETAKYFCLDSSAESIGTTFTYTSSAATQGSKYKLLSEDVRDQDNFGVVAVGDIAAATSSAEMSPIFIKPGGDNSKSISFKKGCYNAFIELVDFDSKTSVPSVDGMGKLPDKCTRTGVCVVHWCGSNKIVLSATTRKSPTKFKISAYIGGQKTAMQDVPVNTEYCLQQAQPTSSSCKKSRSFTVPVSAFEAKEIPSTNAKRGSITIEKRADTTKSLECFDLPYDWNFDGFGEVSMTGNSAVSSFYTPQFEVPANIVRQTQLQLVDVANDIGGALAVYLTHDGSQSVIKAQVCTSENKSVELPFRVTGTNQIGSRVTKTAAISDSGTVVVIEDDGELKIFNLNAVSDTWEQKATITDVPATIIQVALSTHGHFLAALFVENGQEKALLYQKDKLGLTYSRSEDAPLVINNPSADQVSVYASESGLVSLAVRSKTSNTVLQTIEIHFVCSDSNSRFLEGGCQCRDGYVMKSDSYGLKKYLENGDYCIPQVHSTMLHITGISAEIPLHQETISGLNLDDLTEGIKLEVRDDSRVFADVQINDKATVVDVEGQEGPKKLELTGLKPGKMYALTMKYYETFVRVRFVTRCTCDGDEAEKEKTGAPKDMTIVEQKNGRVYFSFVDNSLCENIFSFTRYAAYEEFSESMDSAISFGTMSRSSDTTCDHETILPNEEVFDNLSLSKLIVGKTYVYCVQAGSSGRAYMPSPYDSSDLSQDLGHSDASCTPHVIQWEASINGVVTTEPHSGSLPIEGVTVSYQLLSMGYEDLSCQGCSGSITTSTGGGFEIDFLVAHPYLEGVTHLDEIPVKLKFRKTTTGTNVIPHTFLCNLGEEVCNDDGHIMFLKHLEFNKKVEVYDATQVMFSGNVFILDTVFAGSAGCPTVNAEVKIYHKVPGSEFPELLTEATTDSQGRYEAPVVIGSVINRVEISYLGHKFMAAASNNYDYDVGILISADGLYKGNDFVDVSRTSMTLEVAGGDCNLPLGKSTAKISILGCDWPGKTIIHDTYNGDEYKKRVVDLPAAVLEVELIEIQDQQDERIDEIWDAFQNPVVFRVIDLRETAEIEDMLQKEEEREVHTNTGTAEDEAGDLLADKDKVMEEEETVRFQYDGTLKMSVSIEHSSAYEVENVRYDQLSTKIGFDSFHVIDYMSLFKLRVDLEYEIIKDEVYCSKVDDTHTVNIHSNLGADRMDGFDDFYKSVDYVTQRALIMCSDVDLANVGDIANGRQGSGLCNVTVSQTQDIGGNTFSGIDYTLITGRPNPYGDFTRNLFISVASSAKAIDVRHSAKFFIQGNYGKGNGNMFALPTHNPIMILRDPPGGSSYASYENVVTKSRIAASETVVNIASSIDLTIAAGTSFDGDLCTGGGMGAIVLFCTGVSDAEFEGEIPLGGGISADMMSNSDERSNEISTTWSYTTSEEPARAGEESDVFIVPNLSVMYEEIFLVKWNRESSKPKLVTRNSKTEFESSVAFDLQADSSKPALSFYTLYHLKLVKIPELESAITSQKDTIKEMSSSIICCPSPQKGSCLGKITATNPGRICVDSDKDYENLKLSTLQMALDGWKNTIKSNEDAKKAAKDQNKRISNWFQGNGGNNEDLKITDIETPLVPEKLISSATMMDGTSQLLNGQEGAGSDNNRDSIRKAMRVQISGDAGMLEMSMSKGSTEAYTKQNCNPIIPGVLSGVFGGAGAFAGLAAAGAGAGLAAAAILPIAGGAIALGTAFAGCNYSLDLSAGVGGLSTSFEGPGVLVGVEGGMNFDFHVEHSSSITNEEGIETSVSFGLGDPDDGDEIVLDIYHDEMYGSFVFDTVGGITRCRWEKGTIKGEDPRVRILSQPSQFIFPDKEIVFDIEFLNIGEHVYSYFLIAQDIDDTTSALEIRLDTFESLDYEGIAIKLDKETPEFRFVRVTRETKGYEFLPARLALRSACEFAMDYETEPVSEYLYNYVKPGTNEKRLKWIEPCPTVQWAGELKRDQGFLRNNLSSNKDSLTVTVFNPKYHEKNSTFVEKLVPKGRLEKISFLYRKKGTTTWRNGKMQSENGLVDMDFAQSEESDYGFISLDWFIGDGLLQDASYEVIIEAKCDKIAGPLEFQYSRDDIITGVIDFNPPEPYGYPQPLEEEVLLGQEMYVEFTEDLDCRTPFSFDIEMTIAGPTASPSLSLSPSSSPSGMPSTSASPSDLPSSVPSTAPSDIPSSVPSLLPSDIPSNTPSSIPSSVPSDVPSLSPSDAPSDFPSSIPSLTNTPSSIPSSVPSDVPSLSPSDAPSDFPSSIPSLTPSTIPSDLPSDIPSNMSVPNGGSSRTRNLTNVGSSHRRLSQNSDFVLRNGDGLHVICEGRKIQFQVDYTSGLSVSQINGQEFTVEIGKIGGESLSYIEDKNENPIDHQTKGNVRFTKRFAAMDLSRASTRFRFLKRSKGISCSVDGERQLRSELSQFSSLQIDDRLNISEVYCDEKNSVLSAEVEIASVPNSRRLLKGSNRSTSSDIFESLKGALNNDESVGTEQRLLREGVSYSIQDVRIIPCKEDLEMYSIDVNSDADHREEADEDVDTEMRNGGNRELKQIENEDKLESIEGALLKMKQMESMREMKLKEHDQKLLDEMEKKKELEIKEMKELEKKRELEMKEVEQKRELEMKEHEQTLLDEMQRMKDSEESMMKYQLAMVFGGCLFASCAIIQMMRRQNN